MSQNPSEFEQVLQTLQAANVPTQTIEYIQQLGQIASQATSAQQQTKNQIKNLSDQLKQMQTAISTQQNTISVYQQAQAQSAQQSAITSTVKLEKPSKFNGNQKEFSSWLFNFEQYCEIIGINKKPIEMAQYAVTLFDKNAQTWWQVHKKLKPITLALATLRWQTLKSEMESQFKDQDRERKLLASFQDFKQLNELDTYVTNFRKLTLELGSLVTDEAVLWQFVRGLKPHLRKEVLKDPNLTVVSDAILIAERLNAAEKFAENFQQYKHKNKKYREQILGDHSDPMEIDNMQKTRGKANNTRGKGTYGTRGVPNARDTRVNAQNATIVCYYCGRTGHFARNCYQKQLDQKQQLNHMNHQQHTTPETCQNCAKHVFPPPPNPKN